MSGEWMKVMLEEISRKKTEDEQARAEERRRADERGRGDPHGEAIRNSTMMRRGRRALKPIAD